MPPADRSDAALKEALDGVRLHDALQAKLLQHDVRIDGTLKPEGAVRVAWIRKLIGHYGFDSKQIDIEVPAGRVGRAAHPGAGDTVFADVVVYRDDQHSEPFVVVETKKPDEQAGLHQTESYARNLGAEYHIWANGSDQRCFFTSRFPNKSETIGDIPRWVGNEPVAEAVPKSVRLPAFRDENQMRAVVHQCHERILEKQGHDPAKSFDELTKLLFLKMYDEREVPDVYKFMVIAGDDEASLSKSLRALFAEAIKASRYRDVFYSKFSKKTEVSLEIDDFTLFEVVKLLQGFSLVSTTINIQGADIKGTVFEQMVGNTFRGELAQFFTPRELVHCIAEMIPPSKEEKVFDPSCGSGGFLVMAIRSIGERLKREHPNLSTDEIAAQVRYFAESKIFGSDINDRMGRVAKMNMIMHGDGHAGIVNTNGLLTEKDVPPPWIQELQPGDVDIIYSNPPFAGREKDPVILSQFDLGKNKNGDPCSVSKEVLFIELITKLLKVGGRAGLVLPAGCFNNPSMKNLRDYIKKNVKITALIGLPHLAFQISGANNEGHLLFIEKVQDLPQDYDIFIDWAADIGFDSVGRKTQRNDLTGIAERFHNPPAGNVIRFSQLGDRIDPWYYHPHYRDIIGRLSETDDTEWLPMGQVVTLSKDLFKRAEYDEEDVLEYIEKGDVDMDSGLVVSFSEHSPKQIPGRAKFVLKAGDILFPNAYDCMRGVIVVPQEYDGYIGSSRFFVVRHNPEKMLAEYLPYHFRRPEILSLLKRECSGEINPGINWPQFSKVKIPVPSIARQRKVLDDIAHIQAERERLTQEMARLDGELDTQIATVVQNLITNYEDVKIRRAEFIADVKLP